MLEISVIIPCYNVEKYIGRCMDSVIAQTIGTDMMEIICLDDRSTDSTLEVLRDYASRYADLIRVIELPENGRQGRARNIGLDEAAGRWIAFVDSDDWVEPDYLEKLLECTQMSDAELDVVCCGYARDFSKELTYFDRSVQDNETSRTGVQPDDPSILYINCDTYEERRQFLRERILDYAVYSKLIRRNFLIDNEIYFPEGLVYEDIYWGGMINMYASRVCKRSDVLYHYFVNENATLLSAGAGYHYDMLTVWEQLWNEYISRGLMDRFADEIELEFVYSCALAFWKVIALRFDEPPYNMYQLLCTYTRTHIPGIFNNPYVSSGALPEMYMLMLESLFNPLGKEHFIEFAQNIRKIGI